MILLQILEHDLHRTRKGVSAIPAVIETPAKESHLPAIISTSRGKFIPIRWISKPGQKFGNLVPLQGGGIVAGVFEHDPDRLDDIIGPMMTAALELSMEEKWPNVFQGKDAASAAFDYVQRQSGVKSQPHVCLVPDSWSESTVRKWFRLKESTLKYKKCCRITSSKVSFPVFLSRPDMVGMYTQFMGGNTSILLHNVKSGIGLCPILS